MIDDNNDDAGFDELEGLNPEADAGVVDAPESIDDSIAAAFEEVDAKAVEAKPEEEKPEVNPVTEAARTLANSKRKGKGPKQVIEAQGLDVPGKPQKQTIDPPDDWDVKLKEQFNGLDPVTKQRSREFWDGMKGNATKAMQEIHRTKDEVVREKQRYSEVNEVVDHYLPRWNMQGHSAGQVAREMFAAQEVLMRDPALAIATLIKNMRVDYDAINSHLDGSAPNTFSAPQNIPQQQAPQGLTEERIVEILEERERQRQISTEVTSAQSEIAALKNQTSHDGRTYLYPELHSQDDIERLKPLVDNIRKTQPGISWTNAAILAIQKDRYNPSLGSPSSNVSRLPNQQEIQRARAASVSVRGRGNAVIPNGALPKEESVEESLNAIFRNNGSNY